MSQTLGTNRGTRTHVQTAAAAVGIAFLVVGVLGFIPGITTNYGDLGFAGHTSDAKLLGIFEVSVLHNLVHLVLGAAGVALARTPESARTYLLGGGVVYLVVWLYGLLVGQESQANFVPLNGADNWLHLLLGLAMIALGVLLTRRTHAGTTRGH